MPLGIGSADLSSEQMTMTEDYVCLYMEEVKSEETQGKLVKRLKRSNVFN